MFKGRTFCDVGDKTCGTVYSVKSSDIKESVQEIFYSIVCLKHSTATKVNIVTRVNSTVMSSTRQESVTPCHSVWMFESLLRCDPLLQESTNPELSQNHTPLSPPFL